jgi:hypothetical protein
MLCQAERAAAWVAAAEAQVRVDDDGVLLTLAAMSPPRVEAALPSAPGGVRPRI